MIGLIFCWACETEVDVEMPSGTEKLVVEGYIDVGLPPVVLVSKSSAYFEQVNLSDKFVSNAKVFVNKRGEPPVELIEIRLRDLDEAALSLLSSFIQLDNISDSIQLPDISFYTTLAFLGEEETDYELKVAVEEDTLWAETRIRQIIPLEDVFYRDHPDEDNDSLVRVIIRVNDPPEPGNFYRYFTQRNQEPTFPGLFVSVADDRVVNGQVFNFPIFRGQAFTEEFDEVSSGYFKRGDTVVVQFSHIDRPHFDFWYNLENNPVGGGNPFASQAKIPSNIEGGLGIFGGYASAFDTLYIPDLEE